MKLIYIIDGKAYTSLRKLCRDFEIPYYASYYRIKRLGSDETNGITTKELK
jgi:hypothetical protein